MKKKREKHNMVSGPRGAGGDPTLASTTQPRFAAKGGKPRPGGGGCCSDSPKLWRQTKDGETKEEKRSAGGLAATAQMNFMEDVTAGERMRGREEGSVRGVLFESCVPFAAVTHFLPLFFSHQLTVLMSATCR